MVRENKTTHPVLGTVFMLLALCAALSAVWLCARPQTGAANPAAPVSGTSPEVSAAVFEEFFSCLGRKDFAGADRCLAEGSLGLDMEPEDESSAALWHALRESWSFTPAGEATLSGTGLVRAYRVQSLDLTALPEKLNALVNERLARAAETATLKSEVYDENGEYLPELITSSMEQALKELLDAPEPYYGTRDVEIQAENVDGQWRIRADSAFMEALTGGAVKTVGAAELPTAWGDSVNKLTARALEGLAVVPVVYRIPENAVVAPKPTKSHFGRSKKAKDTAPVLEAAKDLLEGKDLIWSVDTKMVDDQWVNWYQDETIFAVTWRQSYGGMYFTFCEVVVAHPSQFRRYLADNAFNSRYRYTPTQMAKTVNAVVGISGDFYKYRKLGIVVYQRELYRNEMKKLDICFVDASGNLHYVRRGTFKDEQSVRDYLRENDIVFSLAFGPIMIENGEVCLPKGKYPVGQIQQNYTRCSISQLGEGHYFVAVAALKHSNNTLDKMAAALKSLGIDNAYALDGGQTASIIINGRLVNPVDFGEERMMSDIIYFATALPNGE